MNRLFAILVSTLLLSCSLSPIGLSEDQQLSAVGLDRKLSGGSVWVTAYGTGKKIEADRDIIETTSGGLLTVGVSSEIDGDSELMIRHTDHVGVIDWVKSYRFGTLNRAISIDRLVDGSYIVLGDTRGYDLKGNYLGSRLLVTKIKENGSVVWAKTYSLDNIPFSQNIFATKDGGAILSFYTQPFGSTNKQSYIKKIDTYGNIEWARNYNGPFDDRKVNQVIQLSDGNYAFIGQSHDRYRTWVTKLNPDGSILWEKTYEALLDGEPGVTLKRQEGVSLAEMPDGNIVLLSTLWIQVSNVYSLVMQIDSEGMLQWSKKFQRQGALGDFAEWSEQVLVDGDNIVFSSNGHSGGVFWSIESLLVRLTGKGQFLSFHSLGGDQNDYLHGLKVAQNGDYLLAGETESYGAGEWDAWVVRTHNDGYPIGPGGFYPPSSQGVTFWYSNELILTSHHSFDFSQPELIREEEVDLIVKDNPVKRIKVYSE
jgi:hypothetical protein